MHLVLFTHFLLTLSHLLRAPAATAADDDEDDGDDDEDDEFDDTDADDSSAVDGDEADPSAATDESSDADDTAAPRPAAADDNEYQGPSAKREVEIVDEEYEDKPTGPGSEKLVYINEVIFSGLPQGPYAPTKEDLLKMLSTQEGQWTDATAIGGDLNNLKSTGLFSSVESKVCRCQCRFAVTDWLCRSGA